MTYQDKFRRLNAVHREVGASLSDRELRLAILAEEALELAQALSREVRALRAQMDEDCLQPRG